ncbi:MAG: type II toxin-antitoxin system HicA family toxin [Candidatus Arcticimaribacter sp.]
MKSGKLIKILQKEGWQLVRTKGSHLHFKHPTRKGIVTVPHPKKDIPKGTVGSILRQAGLK